MSANIDFKQILRRSNENASLTQRAVDNRAENFSLVDLVSHQSEFKLLPTNTRRIDETLELSEICARASGVRPYGTWVPLNALARDLTTVNGAGLLAPRTQDQIQTSLAPYAAIMDHATVLSGLQGGSLSLPSFDSPAVDAGSAWIAEGTPGPSLTPSTRAATLVPKTIIFQVVVSRRLIATSNADLEGALRREILQRVTSAIDFAALNGSGPNQPQGLLNDPELQILGAGANGAAPTWNHMTELEFQVANRVGPMSAPAFLTSPALRKKLRTTQRAAGLGFIAGDDNQLLGQPLRVSSNMPDNLVKGTSGAVASAMIFGDWSEVHVGFWGPVGIDILVDSRTGAKDGVVKLTCRAEVGVVARSIKAFTAFKDLLAA